MAALAIAAATVPIGTTHASAQTMLPLVPFINGDAQGVAQAVRIAPAVGSFQVAIAIGTSIAGYNDTEGKASAQNLDLGAVGTTLTGPQCDGSNPQVNSTQLPQPLIAESPDGKTQTKQADLVTDASNAQNTDGSKPGTTTLPATSPADAGVLKVTSTAIPSGEASTQGGAFALGGAVTISGANSAAKSTVVGGVARDVVASASVGSISLAGLVTLGNVVETVHQRTGAGAVRESSFTIGSIKVGPLALPVSPDKLAGSIASANAALATTGLHLTLPLQQNMPDGSVVMTPLSIGVSDSALLAKTAGQVVNGTQAVTDQVKNQLISANCQFGSAFSIGDLFVTGPATGTGSLNLLIGGLTAGSDGTSYGNPFGNGTLGGGLGGGVETLTPGTSGTAGTPGTAGEPAAGGSLGTAPTAGTAPAAQQPQLATTANQTVIGALCDTTHLFRHPGCSGNHAVPVAVGSLVAILGLGYADAMAGRGRLRRRGGGLAQIKL